jgi:hypothetical protein
MTFSLCGRWCWNITHVSSGEIAAARGTLAETDQYQPGRVNLGHGLPSDPL